MYKMLVVDDKVDLTEGIIKIGRWSEMDFEVVGKAYDGRTAYELINEHKPDVVITDIRMPLMDGLELTKMIKEHYPFTKVIILSGYDDFKYAQQAIKLGAEEYLLKPASIRMVEEAVFRAYCKLEDEKKKREESVKLQQKLIQSLPLLKDEYFRQLVSAPAEDGPEKAKKKFEFLEIGLNTENFSVMLIELDCYSELYEKSNIEEAELYKFAVSNISQEIIADYFKCEVFRFTDNKIVIMINYLADLTESENKARILKAAELIRESVKECLGITVTIGIGGLYRSLNEVYYSFLDAKDAIAHKIYLGSNCIILSEDVRINHHTSFNYPIHIEKEIISALKLGVSDKIEPSLNRFLDEILCQKDISPAFFKKLILQFLFVISRIMSEFVETNQMEDKDYTAELDKYKTVGDIRAWLLRILSDAATSVQAMKKTQLEKDIYKAKEYINNHFCEDITLQKVSDHICLSPTYFSTVFKEVAGETFIEYIKKARIEKAKELLVTGDYRIYEVANLVGYEDRRYFSEVFKKHTGMNPAEYASKDKSS